MAHVHAVIKPEVALTGSQGIVGPLLHISTGQEVDILCSSFGQFPGRTTWRKIDQMTNSKNLILCMLLA